MYNRYIPQNDGSYRRNRVPDPTANHPPQRESPPERPKDPPPEKPFSPPHHGSVGGFLRQLLPADFDTGDLIIVLLLLLMAGDKPEDRSNALLTLALYFLM